MKIFPNADVVTPGQLGINLARINQQRDKMLYVAKQAAQKKKRQQELMSSFESLDSYDNSTISKWVQDYNITPEELNEIQPYIKQRQDDINKKVLEQKKQKITQDILSLNGPVTKNKINSVLKKNNVSSDMVKSLKPFLSQFTTEIKTPESYTQFKEAGHLVQKNDQTGKVSNILTLPKAQIAAVPTDNTPTKVEIDQSRTKAYTAAEKEMSKLYLNQNYASDKTQRAQYFRGVARTMDYVDQISKDTGILPEQAYPLARRKILKENQFSEQLQQQLPSPKQGWHSTLSQTVIELKKLRSKTDVPNHIVRDALVKKGWDNDSINKILVLAQSLVSKDTTSLAKLTPEEKNKINSVREGQFFKLNNGEVWKREGDFFVNLNNGERVSR